MGPYWPPTRWKRCLRVTPKVPRGPHGSLLPPNTMERRTDNTEWGGGGGVGGVETENTPKMGVLPQNGTGKQ